MNLNSLKTFDSISLKEMDAVKLMNRIDFKFIFRSTQLEELLEQLSPFYKCLHIEDKLVSTYKTLYYDTSDLKFYNQHHNGKLNRYKIRNRTYVESKLSFLEIKFKNNKGRTIKKRIKEDVNNISFSETATDFFKANLIQNIYDLKPILNIHYKRITLVNKINAERVTIDFNMEFINQNQLFNASCFSIAEVKQDAKNKSPFFSLMKQNKISEGSLSKYCMAIAFTHPSAKKNNFKEKLLHLKRNFNYDAFTISN